MSETEKVTARNVKAERIVKLGEISDYVDATATPVEKRRNQLHIFTTVSFGDADGYATYEAWWPADVQHFFMLKKLKCLQDMLHRKGVDDLSEPAYSYQPPSQNVLDEFTEIFRAAYRRELLDGEIVNYLTNFPLDSEEFWIEETENMFPVFMHLIGIDKLAYECDIYRVPGFQELQVFYHDQNGGIFELTWY